MKQGAHPFLYPVMVYLVHQRVMMALGQQMKLASHYCRRSLQIRAAAT
jgi:hypothetical protein